MSATSGRRIGQGALFAGVAFILAATVLNLAHDTGTGYQRMFAYELETLPVVGEFYAAAGKVGTTLFLVTLGMVCLLVGLRYWGRSGPRAYLRGEDRPVTAAAVSGRIVLETWKYVTPPDGSPAVRE